MIFPDTSERTYRHHAITSIRAERVAYKLFVKPRINTCCKLGFSARERWAQLGITIEFLVTVRTMGEFFRLRYAEGTSFSAAVAALYIGGALIAVCSCWAGVIFYFFRRFTLSAGITLATVPVLLVYKIVVIG